MNARPSLLPLFALFSFVFLAGCLQAPTSPASASVTPAQLGVLVVINNGSANASQLVLIPNDTTAFAAFSRVANLSIIHYSFGNYVSSVNGLSENNASGLYWQYYFDNVLGPVSVDNYHLEHNGTLEFRYEQPAWIAGSAGGNATNNAS